MSKNSKIILAVAAVILLAAAVGCILYFEPGLIIIGPGSIIKSTPLTITIRSEKSVYEAGEEIILSGEIKKVLGPDIYIYPLEETLTVAFDVVDSKGKKIEALLPVIDLWPPKRDDFILLKTDQSIPKTFRLFIPEETVKPGLYTVWVKYNIREKGYYQDGKFIDLSAWTGTLTSNPISIKVVEKNMLVENCKNLCGDGVCQEVVCQMIGCPCAETAATCPADCAEGGQSGGTGLANPASVNCEKLGGKVKIRFGIASGQTGYCVFPNGQECEEWALLRNECSLSPLSQMGVLEGKVTVGPICPVERVDRPCPVPEAAYTSREVVVYKTDETTEVARQHFTKDGSYKFELAPGTYVINTQRQGVGGSKDLPQTVIIKAGETLKLNFDIDTGIR